MLSTDGNSAQVMLMLGIYGRSLTPNVTSFARAPPVVVDFEPRIERISTSVLRSKNQPRSLVVAHLEPDKFLGPRLLVILLSSTSSKDSPRSSFALWTKLVRTVCIPMFSRTPALVFAVQRQSVGPIG